MCRYPPELAEAARCRRHATLNLQVAVFLDGGGTEHDQDGWP